MDIQITSDPVRFRLRGRSSPVEQERYAEVGLELMDDLWRLVRQARLATTGINHWVYLPGGRMFVGVELNPPEQPGIPDELEPLDFELTRRLEHRHVGPYRALPAKWKSLLAELAARGESVGSPSLEIYGHTCADPTQAETRILIGLRPRQ
jgi:hypothetical protein